MEYFIVCLAALIVAGLTLFSGFGLGTLLMPVFALFFPLEVAIASTAAVHLANNLFKLGLMGKYADRRVVALFAVPGAILAIFGAVLLGYLAHFPPLTQYALGSRLHTVTLVKIIIAVLITFFAMFELLPPLQNLTFDRKYLPLGGALSGFFGGLSGLQGALRSVFLIKIGLSKEAFIGTGVVAAVVVDLSRLIVYGISFFAQDFALLLRGDGIGLVVVATLAAFVGSFAGSRLIEKVTMKSIQGIVGLMLILLALALATGLI